MTGISKEQEEVEEYIRNLKWSDNPQWKYTQDEVKTLVAGNIRAFAQRHPDRLALDEKLLPDCISEFIQCECPHTVRMWFFDKGRIFKLANAILSFLKGEKKTP